MSAEPKSYSPLATFGSAGDRARARIERDVEPLLGEVAGVGGEEQRGGLALPLPVVQEADGRAVGGVGRGGDETRGETQGQAPGEAEESGGEA